MIIWSEILISAKEYWFTIVIFIVILFGVIAKKIKARREKKHLIEVKKMEEKNMISNLELPTPEEYGQTNINAVKKEEVKELEKELPSFGDNDNIFISSDNQDGNIPEMIDQVNKSIDRDSKNLIMQAEKDLTNFTKKYEQVVAMKENIRKQGQKLSQMHKDYGDREKNIKQSIDGLKRILNKKD